MGRVITVDLFVVVHSPVMPWQLLQLLVEINLVLVMRIVVVQPGPGRSPEHLAFKNRQMLWTEDWVIGWLGLRQNSGLPREGTARQPPAERRHHAEFGGTNSRRHT
jgi:hypothetical protein